MLLLLLAAGSGAAALIYEVVWFQQLELVLGSSAVSLAIILGTFMGGTCAGSLLFPRLSTRWQPLRVYVGIELGIAVCAVAVVHLIPWLGAASFLCLLPPTLLMGATLPALARCTKTPHLLYSANIAGAVFGCLLAGFYLLRTFDVATATYVAAAINATVAGLAMLGTSREEQAKFGEASRDRTIYTVIALSGLCALACEVIWTRTLGLLLGASVYTLSIILAVFLCGLGIGSTLARTVQRPREALGWCQLFAAAGIAWTSNSLSASLPYWPINPSISTGIGFNFELDVVRALWALLPPTLCWGASFTLALTALRGNAMPQVYSANTVGAIIGALGASLWGIAALGSQRSEQLLMFVSIGAGLLLLARVSRWSLLAAVSCGLLTLTVPPLSKLLVAHGRFAATWVDKGDIVYAGEGVNSSVAVSSFADGTMTFHVAGKIQASNTARDLRLQRMLGHLTTLMSPSPRSVLVIGCGAGVTAGAVSIDPRVERVTIAEIEPLVPQAAAAYFGEPNFDVLRNPKVRLQIEDGRHYLLNSREKFDGITVDPLDPWVKGAANLYTKEFYEAAKQHLKPGGTITMYVQLFETDEAAVKSTLATFFEVFPNGTIWGNPYQGLGHDMVLLGQAEPLRIDLDEMEQRFGYGDDRLVPDSLAEAGFQSPVDLFATYAGRGSDLRAWLEGAEINRDTNLRMQYLAGFGLNLDDSAAIYAALLAHRKFPEDAFTSREGRVDSLRRALALGR